LTRISSCGATEKKASFASNRFTTARLKVFLNIKVYIKEGCTVSAWVSVPFQRGKLLRGVPFQRKRVYRFSVENFGVYRFSVENFFGWAIVQKTRRFKRTKPMPEINPGD
jgi:hypothetical protein